MGSPRVWIMRIFLEHTFGDACHCFSHGETIWRGTGGFVASLPFFEDLFIL
jgi:hypothetical protein